MKTFSVQFRECNCRIDWLNKALDSPITFTTFDDCSVVITFTNENVEHRGIIVYGTQPSLVRRSPTGTEKP